MKHCINCFRFKEDWRDAEKKGLPIRRWSRLSDHMYRPRNGVKIKAICGRKYQDITHAQGIIACRHYMPRWVWNLRTWWQWRFMRSVRVLYRKLRVPIGGLRKPVPIEWQDHYNFRTDRIDKDSWPKCPRCKEMPYSMTQCVFCGQRFLPSERMSEFDF